MSQTQPCKTMENESAISPLLSSNCLQNFKQIKQKTPEILQLHFHFLIVLHDCVSDMSYLCQNEAESLQNRDVYLAQILDFGMGYPKNHLAY